jgi:hypothetical protein
MAASCTTRPSLPCCDHETKVVSTRDSSGSDSHRKHVVARNLESLEKVGTSSGWDEGQGVADDADPPVAAEAALRDEDRLCLSDLEKEEALVSHSPDEDCDGAAISRCCWSSCCGRATVMPCVCNG